MLPFDMPMDKLMSPLHGSRPRNRIIAQAFFDMGIIERYGRGIRRIKEECDKNGNSYPTWNDECGSFVTEYRAKAKGTTTQSTTQTTTQSTTLQTTLETTLQTTLETTQQTTLHAAQETKLEEKLDGVALEIAMLMKRNPKIKIDEIAISVGITRDGVNYHIKGLKNKVGLRHSGADQDGRWEFGV